MMPGVTFAEIRWYQIIDAYTYNELGAVLRERMDGPAGPK